MRPSVHRRGHDCADILREYLARGVTGRLERGRPGSRGGGLHVFVMAGEILAAHGPDDGIWIVRRLVNGGALTERQGVAFTRALERGQPFEELLVSKVPGRVLAAMLEGRFRQNLLDFVTGPSSIRFEPMDTLFVANLQHGHDSLALLRAIVDRRSRIAALAARRTPLTLRPGPSMPATQLEARLLDACDPASSLERLLTFSPYEPGDTLDAVVNMLRTGTLVSDEGVRVEDDVHQRRRRNMPGPGSRPDPQFAVEDLFDAGPPPPAPGIPAARLPPAWAEALVSSAHDPAADDFGDVPEELARRWSGDDVVVELAPAPAPVLEAVHSLEPAELEDLRSIHSLLPLDGAGDEAEAAALGLDRSAPARPIALAPVPAPPPAAPVEVADGLTEADVFAEAEASSLRLDGPAPALLGGDALAPHPDDVGEALAVGDVEDSDELDVLEFEDDESLVGIEAAPAVELPEAGREPDSVHEVQVALDDDELGPEESLGGGHAIDDFSSLQLDFAPTPSVLPVADGSTHVLGFGAPPAADPTALPDEGVAPVPVADLFAVDAEAADVVFDEEADGGADEATSDEVGTDGSALVEAARRYLEEAQSARSARQRDGARESAETLSSMLDGEAPFADDEAVAVFDEDEVVARPPGFVFHDAEVDETELAAFADNDASRGGGGQGLFTLERRLLDVVDLREETLRSLAAGSEAPTGPVAEEEPVFLEMGEATEEDEAAAGAVSLNFSAPVVSADEAVQRAEVAVDVLRRLARQLDHCTGPGTGQTASQLLLDAAPNQFGPLLHGLQADRSGGFSAPMLVSRLNERPQGERRLLLDRCLSDLIERALGIAVEELPEAAVDAYLEEIAGYQQRLRA